MCIIVHTHAHRIPFVIMINVQRRRKESPPPLVSPEKRPPNWRPRRRPRRRGRRRRALFAARRRQRGVRARFSAPRPSIQIKPSRASERWPPPAGTHQRALLQAQVAARLPVAKAHAPWANRVFVLRQVDVAGRVEPGLRAEPALARRRPVAASVHGASTPRALDVARLGAPRRGAKPLGAPGLVKRRPAPQVGFVAASLRGTPSRRAVAVVWKRVAAYRGRGALLPALAARGLLIGHGVERDGVVEIAPAREHAASGDGAACGGGVGAPRGAW
jgi:hypothetical protein